MKATDRGKEFAVKALKGRVENPPGRIDNSSLCAGALMYFYCRICGHLSDTLPESYITPPTKMCIECKALKEEGWLADAVNETCKLEG